MLEANVSCAGDEHFSTGDERIQCTRSSISHTHSWLPATCKQNLCPDDYIVKATYLGNGRDHIVGIQKVSKCTMFSFFCLTELVFKAKKIKEL